jgi:hypothetical protein
LASSKTTPVIVLPSAAEAAVTPASGARVGDGAEGTARPAVITVEVASGGWVGRSVGSAALVGASVGSAVLVGASVGGSVFVGGTSVGNGAFVGGTSVGNGAFVGGTSVGGSSTLVGWGSIGGFVGCSGATVGFGSCDHTPDPDESHTSKPIKSTPNQRRCLIDVISSSYPEQQAAQVAHDHERESK